MALDTLRIRSIGAANQDHFSDRYKLYQVLIFRGVGCRQLMSRDIFDHGVYHMLPKMLFVYICIRLHLEFIAYLT